MNIICNRSIRKRQRDNQAQHHPETGNIGRYVIRNLLLVIILLVTPAAASEKPPIMANPTVVQQLRHDLLVQTAKWAMPVVSFFANKQAMIEDFGIETGTVVY
jgi:hypothetical protein